MKYNRFINKLKKRLGQDIEIQADAMTVNGRKEWLVHGNYIASWRVQGSYCRDLCDYNPAGPLEVSSFHARRVDDHPDSMTDYFPGTYWSNGTQLIDWLKPPPPKYPTGALVRGKLQNKRAKRLGYAGKTALVMRTSGKYMSLKFVDVASERLEVMDSHRQKMTYPVRDFELISG